MAEGVRVMVKASETVELAAGPLTLTLAPGIGGSVATFRHGETDIMRPLSLADAEAGNVLGTAMFPMVPYANRISGNAFDFRGRTYRFKPNLPPDRHILHGSGWQLPWSVDRATGDEALLSLADRGDPYQYRATQHFALDPAGLTVSMTITNNAPDPMPFGFGLHPWFIRDPDVTLQFVASTFYLEEPEHLAGDRITLPPELGFAREGPLPDRWRNNDFGGWDGAAMLRFPSRGFGLRISADPVFRHLMVYADPARPFFCIEPQTHASGAFNRKAGFDDPDEGILVLGPGEQAGGTVRFDVVSA
jgi:aldose 1-epimerase